LWDEDVPGLAVRATANKKVFIFQGRLAGKTIRVKIGDCRSWAIDSTDPALPGARQEARRLQGLFDKGVDPRLDKQNQIEATQQQQVEALRETLTVAETWNTYIESRRGRWSERHLADHFSLANPGGMKAKRRKGNIKPGPLAPLMKLKLTELTPERVEAWAMLEVKTRPGRARLAFALLKSFINWCDQMPDLSGLVTPDVCSTRIKRNVIPRQKPKDDCLQKEQLPAWFAAVRGLRNPVMSAYLQTLLLTGARRNELAGLKWADVDFRWNSLTIHDKVEGERTIPLTPHVAALLAPLPRRNQFVFSSPVSVSKRLEEPRRPHNKALDVAGIEGLTIHGLRRSFGTLSEWVEVPVGVVAQLMGHKPSATAEKHYRRRPLDLLRLWHEKIEAWILNEAGIELPQTVNVGLHVAQGGK